jgi:profilin
MSWQDYVTTNLVGTGFVAKGAIYGLDGNHWAISPGLNIKPDEIKKAIAGFSNGCSDLRANGLYFSGEKYLVIKGDDRSIYAKKGNTGVAMVKTGQAVLVGFYGDKTQPGQCNNTVEKLADYLIEQGY